MMMLMFMLFAAGLIISLVLKIMAFCIRLCLVLSPFGLMYMLLRPRRMYRYWR